MTTPEIITDAMVDKMKRAFAEHDPADIPPSHLSMREALLAVQDDMVRPWCNLMDGYKRDAEAYASALKIIRGLFAEAGFLSTHPAWQIADDALKGEYHEKRGEE